MVAIARELLPAGTEPLEQRYEVRRGGLDAGRERDRCSSVAGAAAIVADPTVPVDAALLDAAGPQLRIVANFAVGYDNVDLEACREAGVAVTNTPDVLTNATAELALALTLAAARLIGTAERDLRAGTLDRLGPGRLPGPGAERGDGRDRRPGPDRVPLRGAAAGIRRPSSSTPPGRRSPRPRRGWERAGPSLEELLRRTRRVSLHAPAGPETHHLIDAAALETDAAHAVLVNTSRGSLVDLDAVAAALREGRLGAAGLDVYEGEPEVPPALLEAPRAVLTPHIGSATIKARDGMARTVAENVIAVLEGREPPNRVA